MVLSIQGTVHEVEAYGEDGVALGQELESWEWRQSGRRSGKGKKSKKSSPLRRRSASKKQAPSANRHTEPAEGGKTYSLGLATIVTGPVQVSAIYRLGGVRDVPACSCMCAGAELNAC